MLLHYTAQVLNYCQQISTKGIDAGDINQINYWISKEMWRVGSKMFALSGNYVFWHVSLCAYGINMEILGWGDETLIYIVM